VPVASAVCDRYKFCGKFAVAYDLLDVHHSFGTAVVVQHHQFDVVVSHLIDAVDQTADAVLDQFMFGAVDVSCGIAGRVYNGTTA